MSGHQQKNIFVLARKGFVKVGIHDAEFSNSCTMKNIFEVFTFYLKVFILKLLILYLDGILDLI